MSYFDDNEDWIVYGGRRPSFHDDEPREVECKFCGKGGLHWEETDTGWVLLDGKYAVHNCRSVAGVDEFEDLT